MTTKVLTDQQIKEIVRACVNKMSMQGWEVRGLNVAILPTSEQNETLVNLIAGGILGINFRIATFTNTDDIKNAVCVVADSLEYTFDLLMNDKYNAYKTIYMPFMEISNCIWNLD